MPLTDDPLPSPVGSSHNDYRDYGGHPVTWGRMSETPATELPAHRYDAELANQIERKWQDYWEDEGIFYAPNPTGDLSTGWDSVADRPKLFVMDMFPYPSGSGLHVGHPLGYIGTDVFARFRRMAGDNVLHTLGYDAFGLPAEEYARQTGTHPRTTTEANVANMRRQLRALGLGHDSRRSIATTDPDYYRWTQWIFLQIFNSWYDSDTDGARPIAELVDELASGDRPTPDGFAPWADLSAIERRKVIDSHRLAYVSEAPVNWCPGLGTVLANEEVTADGRSERGNYPVFKRPLKQWMMRITAYADRLLADLDLLDWSDAIKTMQRNWIGRSEGARVTFAATTAAGEAAPVDVFTTRPDTLFGATYMVLSPEHELVDRLIPDAWPAGIPDVWTADAPNPRDAVSAYRKAAAAKSEIERTADTKVKTGVFTGAYAVNPVNQQPLPIFIADYVLTGYGTGAIMAVPAEDQRDWDFAAAFELPVVRTVKPPDDWDGEAFTGDGVSVNSDFLDGMAMADAKTTMIDWLVERDVGDATVTYKLRDWLFSRQRYWGEPFPIVYDETGLPIALPEDQLPVLLPEIDDYAPLPADDGDTVPEPPLSRATDWATVELDLGDGVKTYRRELDTMPQWAGSCWYHLRYLDPTNDDALVDPTIDEYWMGPQGVDLYVGGVEHAVLHLLYARFWQKVLYDLGKVTSVEPYHRLFNQGYIQAAAYTDERGSYVDAEKVEERNGLFVYEGEPVSREYGKMGKSLKNSVTPDAMYARYGADTLRLYEMFMGPLDQDRPWDTTAIIGAQRLLQRIWRNVIDEDTGRSRVSNDPADEETLRAVNIAIEGVRGDMQILHFNTAISKITELNNYLTKTFADRPPPHEAVVALILLLAPLAPHIAEELWLRLGANGSLAFADFPVADPRYLVADTVEMAVQVNGKVRDRLDVAPDISDTEAQIRALASAKVQTFLDGGVPKKVIVRAPRLVNIVV
jgi:leucyl-tRNA synthetase